ncbi:MAG: hypothetical protein K5656_01120 [Lachnospiraceae bacterium]|nr:hypothetical protein [Lachnospiraceae bacterium]
MSSNESFLTKLERKWGRYAIPNLTSYMCILYAIGFILIMIGQNTMYSFLCLDMNAVMHGQVWRLFTFLLIPPDTSFLVIITIIFYWSIGTSLEHTWGTFYYNVYIIGGIIFTWIGTLLGWLIMYIATGSPQMILGTNYYILMSMFLAFAMLYPDHQILFMFILPLKVKWLAYFYYALMAYQVYEYATVAIHGNLWAWGYVVSIVVSLLNFFLFYHSTRRRTKPSRKQMKRKREFMNKAKKVTPAGITRHKCAVCGATEESNPELEFRFCSRCKGNYEYCQNHIFSHQHIQ